MQSLGGPLVLLVQSLVGPLVLLRPPQRPLEGVPPLLSVRQQQVGRPSLFSVRQRQVGRPAQWPLEGVSPWLSVRQRWEAWFLSSAQLWELLWELVYIYILRESSDSARVQDPRIMAL